MYSGTGEIDFYFFNDLLIWPELNSWIMSTNDRANVKNLNNPASKAAADNHSNQKNPTHTPSKTPLGKK